MNANEKKIEWTTKSGKQAAVSVGLILEEEAFADGYRIPLACCKMRIDAEVDGQNMGGVIDRTARTVGGDRYPASIGRLLIPAAQLAEIDAAIAAIAATPEWQRKMANAAANEAADAKYAAHAAKMAKIMKRDY